MNIKNKFILSLLTTLLLLFVINSNVAFAQTDNETEIEESAPTESEEAEAQPQEIKIDEDELPGESVIPKTDNKSSVINKKVTFKNRFLLEAVTGSVLDEPLLNSGYWLVRAGYYTTEEFYFGAGFKSRFGGKTSYGEQIAALTPPLLLDDVPAPTQSHFLAVGYNFFYGKLSFAKETVITASTRLDTDLGMQKVGGTDRPFIQSAVTQSFYFNRNVALGLSIGLSLAQVSDFTSVYIRSAPAPAESAYPTKIQFNQYLSGNLTFLF